MAITITPAGFEAERREMLPFFSPFLIIALVVFIVSVAAYGITMGLGQIEKIRLSELTSEITVLSQKRTSLEAEAKKTERFATQLTLLKNLITRHIRGANMFRILEESVHPEARVLSVSADYGRGTFSISLAADTIRSGAEQVYLLQHEPELFKNAVLESFGVAAQRSTEEGSEKTGRVQIAMTLHVRPELLAMSEKDLEDFLEKKEEKERIAHTL